MVENKQEFIFKETLSKYKFLEKDQLKGKKFILLLRKYKHITDILQNSEKNDFYLGKFPINLYFDLIMKEVKV